MPRDGQPIRARVKIGKAPGDCWVWLTSLTPTGHGKLTFCGREQLAHRWMWEQLFGPIPDGFVVYSTCESKSCVNPHHLACGTQADACRNSVQTKLLPGDVADIRAAKKNAGPATADHLAMRYGVAAQQIREIWRGTSWGRPGRRSAQNKERAA